MQRRGPKAPALRGTNMSLTGMAGEGETTVSLVERIMGSKFLQRKFVLAVVGVLLNWLNAEFQLGWSDEVMTRITVVILGWIGVEGYVDAKKS